MNIPTFEELLRQIKINLWLCGIPLDDPKIKFRFIFLLFLLLLIIIEETSFLVSKISSENLLELTALAPCTGIGILSILKIISLFFKRHNIYELTKHLDGLYREILTDDKKIEIVKRDMVLVKSFSKYYFILNAVLISVYNFSTLIVIPYIYFTTNEVVYSLPYAVIVPFSTDTWLTWSVVYLHSIFCGFICVLFFTTVDVLYCVFTSHIYCNFAIISNEIELLNINNIHVLSDMIKKHQYILKLAEDLENIFTATNLFNVLVASLEICALGFSLTMGEWTQIPGLVLFMLSVLLQILMMCIFGENVIRESTKVGDKAFRSKWYEMDERSKKMILIIMTRANKPNQLTAYKFSVICYGTFTKIISTSWSYFTILKTVYKPSDGA